jgi:2-C-methyl-D-erythritol 2,4-cyclodiphosphate synthase
MKIGFGYDSHRLVEGIPLILGGVEIPFKKGLLGHSDADVLLHAVCDAILGAIGRGDIGRHFPDKDPAFKGISSLILLERVYNFVDQDGFSINNIDSTVIIERPKLQDYMQEMAANISRVVKVSANRVNVKAKTNEGMGFTGRGEGVAAFAMVTLIEKAGL